MRWTALTCQLACQPASEQGFARARWADEDCRPSVMDECVWRRRRMAAWLGERNVGRGVNGLAERALLQTEVSFVHRAST